MGVAEFVKAIAVCPRGPVGALEQVRAGGCREQLEVRRGGLVPAGHQAVDYTQPALAGDDQARAALARAHEPVRQGDGLERADDRRPDRNRTTAPSADAVHKPCGGGGTDFRPAFDAVQTWEEPPVCIIYLTDLAGTFPEQDPGIPTLWVTGRSDAREVPFGELLLANT